MTAQPITEPTTFTCPNCASRKRRAERDRAEGRAPYTYRDACSYCSGTGEVTLDPKAIAEAIVTSRGRAKGTLRRSRPALAADGGVYGAAWVWRMIRFDAGLDLHMPVMATEYVGLSWIKVAEEQSLQDALEGLSNALGNVLFSKIAMMRGAAAWGQVLGMENAEEVAAKVAAAVGLPMGNGYAVGDAIDSPEAAVEEALDTQNHHAYSADGTRYFDIEVEPA